MEIATTGAFRLPASKAGRAALLGGVLAVVLVVAYVVWGRWLCQPAPSTICAQLASYDQDRRIDDAVFSVLGVGESAPSGDSFDDRCMWYFESLRDVDRSFYGQVARCVARATDATGAIECTYSP